MYFIQKKDTCLQTKMIFQNNIIVIKVDSIIQVIVIKDQKHLVVIKRQDQSLNCGKRFKSYFESLGKPLIVRSLRPSSLAKNLSTPVDKSWKVNSSSAGQQRSGHCLTLSAFINIWRILSLGIRQTKRPKSSSLKWPTSKCSMQCIFKEKNGENGRMQLVALKTRMFGKIEKYVSKERSLSNS